MESTQTIRAERTLFWRDATRATVADPAYFDLVSRALDSRVVPMLEDGASVLDFGCGDGSHTLQFAQAGAQVSGIDASATLVEQAREAADRFGFGDVTYSVGDSVPAGQTHDVVSCMGMLARLHDTDAFDKMLHDLAGAVAPGGLLVLRETVSGIGAVTVEHDTHTARYRTPMEYFEPLSNAGMTLLTDDCLAVWSPTERRSNHLWLFEQAR